MVVRLPRIHWWADDLDRELEILPRLAGRVALNIPEPLGRGSPSRGYPFSWAVYRWIAGEPWSRDLVADHTQAARDLAAFVTSLRGVDPLGVPASRRGDLLATQDRQTRDAIADLGDEVDSGIVEALWDAALALPQWHRAPVWLHGDLMPTNILLRDGRPVAVLDFGLSGVGDPAADMLPAWCLFSEETRPVYREGVDLDDATWLRGRGWALTIALQLIPYYAETAPQFAALGRRMLAAVVADAST
jgi:aminoglycoside phosphotransferase (APT) family kinase protein